MSGPVRYNGWELSAQDDGPLIKYDEYRALERRTAALENALAMVHVLADSGLTWSAKPIETIRTELRAMVRQALDNKA